MIKVLYTNAQSLIRKINELNVVSNDLKPQIICINETWSNSEHSNAYLSIEGYEIISRHDRNDTGSGKGGGLLIYVNKNIVASEVELTAYNNFNQACCVKIKLNQRFLNILLVYRPHNLYDGDLVTSNNDKLLHLLTVVPKPAIVLGDFNFSDINWETKESRTRQSKKFLERIDDLFYEQHVDFPTHNSGRTLDLVLSQGEDVLSVEDVGKLGSSDHTMMVINVKGEIDQPSSDKVCKDWNKADFDGMNEFLAETDWVNLLNSDDIETDWTTFKEKIFEAEAIYVPTKIIKSRNQPPWMTRALLRQVRKKRRLWKNYKKYGNLETQEKYRKIESEVKNSIRREKKNYERKIASNSKSNPKMFYSYISKKKCNKVTVGPLKINGDLLTESEDIAKTLNDFFSSVFTRDVDDDSRFTVSPMTIAHQLEEVNFTEAIIIEKLKKLKPFSSEGPDRLKAKTLKETADSISPALLLIYRKSYLKGIVPEDWKMANVTPIFKKGSKFKPENYRPVSLTSIACKVMESILKDQIVKHLNINDLIKPTQHGFMKKRSCLTNLLEYLEIITRIIDEGENADVIYLDFSKAFDKVSHSRLNLILQAHGISGNTLNWINSWLSGRKQRVRHRNIFSQWLEVLSGVPQGSVLGPLLFIIFINLIDEALIDLISFIKKFADDTKVGRKIQTVLDSENLQNDLNMLLEWSKNWKMQFNEDKCKVIHFGKKNPCFNYSMNGISLESMDSEKDVGVMIHNSLKPSLQCNTSAKKANKVLGQMSRSLSYRDKNTWISLYKTYVRPHLEYCVQAWNPWLNKDIEMLENVQKRAVRMVTNLKGNSYEEKLKEVGLTSLAERRSRGDMIQVWKILHNHDNVKNCWFKMASESLRTTRLTSSAWNLTLPITNSDLRRNFFSIRVINNWNALPEHIKSAKSLNLFKNYFDIWQLLD